MSQRQSFLELQQSEEERHTNPQLQLSVILSLTEARRESRGDPRYQQLPPRRQVQEVSRGPRMWGSCLLAASEPRPFKSQVSAGVPLPEFLPNEDAARLPSHLLFSSRQILSLKTPFFPALSVPLRFLFTLGLAF